MLRHVRRADLNTLTDIEEADSLRSVDLMSAGAEHINIELIYIDRDLAECLNSVCMEQDSMLMCYLSDLFQRLRVPISLFAAITEIRMVSDCNGF